ncbi:MAG: S9 family peptidase, partial [Proteobacteria bacterium]|nr:S9 family peptidase [Pseudomonadota bacterium]
MKAFEKLMAGAAILTATAALAAASVQRTAANNGNLIMEDIPAIPEQIVNDLNQFQNVRSASFRDWTENGQGVYISTRFGDVSQIHRVDMPGGARQQITFYKEPVGGVSRQPGGRNLIFTRDTGGSEFTQIFMLDPADGSTKLLTDGESRNGATVWDRQGRRMAYQSTRRNGAANDVWIMDPTEPAKAEMILESPDGTWWGPAEFSESGSKVLILNYVSIADSRVHLLDLDSGQNDLMAGGPDNTSANRPLGF